jgi:alpha-methylacyl-CoA racemase
MHEAPENDHLAHRGSFVSVAGVVQPSPVPRFANSTPTVPTPPVAPGVGGRAALREWGVDEAWIQKLVGKHVVHLADEAAVTR